MIRNPPNECPLCPPGIPAREAGRNGMCDRCTEAQRHGFQTTDDPPQPTENQSAPNSQGDNVVHDNGLGVMRVRSASEMSAGKRKRWLARNRIPLGAVTVLVGDEGIGKSLFWVWLVAAVTRGKAVPAFGIPARDPGHVLLIFTEDGWSEDIMPRLEQAGADMRFVHTLCDSPDGSGSPEFPTDMHHVVTADPTPVLVVVDAWLDTVDPRLRVRDSQQSRQALHPWRQAATVTEAAVLLLSHTNRQASGHTRDLYSASMALRQKARMTLFAQLDTEGYLTIGPDKANGTRGDTVATRFRIDTIQVAPPTDDDDGTVPKLVYVDQSHMTAREIAQSMYEAQSGTHSDNDIPPNLADFAEALRDYIMTGEPCPQNWPEGNRRLSTDVYAAATGLGGTPDKAKRVKDGIGAEAGRDDNAWYWFIPKGKGA